MVCDHTCVDIYLNSWEVSMFDVNVMMSGWLPTILIGIIVGIGFAWYLNKKSNTEYIRSNTILRNSKFISIILDNILTAYTEFGELVKSHELNSIDVFNILKVIKTNHRKLLLYAGNNELYNIFNTFYKATLMQLYDEWRKYQTELIEHSNRVKLSELQLNNIRGCSPLINDLSEYIIKSSDTADAITWKCDMFMSKLKENRTQVETYREELNIYTDTHIKNMNKYNQYQLEHIENGNQMIQDYIIKLDELTIKCNQLFTNWERDLLNGYSN